MPVAIGAKSLTICFSSMQERFCLRQELKLLGGPYSEAEITQYFNECARESSSASRAF
jgi:hypothetical protein